MGTHHNDHDDTLDGTAVTRGVPGGTSRIPRLHSTRHGLAGPGGGPPVEVVGGGFTEDELTRARRSRDGSERDDRGRTSDQEEPVVMRFSDYSPIESLFGAAESGTPTATCNPTDEPTTVLGVDPDADWNTIRAAHRKLLAQLHPDRYVTADDRTRDDAAERLAAVNVAYHELDRTRRAV